MGSEQSSPTDGEEPEGGPAGGPSRRRFIGYLLAAPTLAVAAQLGLETAAPRRAAAAGPIPSGPQQYDLYDLSDLVRDAARPTNHLLTITVNTDGTASFDLPRVEVGQGITTAFAMLIAEELDLPVEKVRITLADARPELGFNQLTGGSSSIFSIGEPVRAAAAVARERLAAAAAQRWDVPVSAVTTRDGAVHGPAGLRAGYGELAVEAASDVDRAVPVRLKDPADFTVIGKARGRSDARDAVTGRKKFAMDLDVPGALPTMVARPPTFRGTVRAVRNLEAVRKMPGVTHVAPISTGVAVRARTFGQCVDAVRALKVDWGPGSVDGVDNAVVGERLKAAELPMAPPLPGTEILDETFVFHFRSGSALEPNNAIADVRADRAEVWAKLGMPILLKQKAAEMLGLPAEKVTVHVTQGGGSFGRKLFSDAALEAVEASKAFGKPVKLMWHRADDSRHGRMHPMARSRVRVQLTDGSVAAYTQRHTSVATDFTHEFGEMYAHFLGSRKPMANRVVMAGVFQITTCAPYNYGEVDHFYDEIYEFDDFPTGSVRNILQPDVCTARELMTDQIARRLKVDPVEFRLGFLKEERFSAVLRAAAKAGNWGRRMPAGTAQGIALHSEYKGRVATLVEIDCRPATVNRKIRDAYTGPRVTKVVTAVDVGRAVNPAGLDAQMMGGAMDGIAQALSAGLHISDGLPLEASWDNYRYTRHWNAPLEFRCVIMPPSTGEPGGAGELNCGVTQAAVACAYARATGRLPTEFPINFREPLGFVPKSKIPSVPQSPTAGLRHLR
jgi:isoquinoline 1-oxidoreductase beta subunit